MKKLRQSWKDLARLTWANGEYATKTELARAFNVHVQTMCECLDPDYGRHMAEYRKARRRKLYAENPSVRAAEIQRVKSRAKGSTGQTGQRERVKKRYAKDPEFRERMKAKSRAQYARTRNGRPSAEGREMSKLLPDYSGRDG